MNLFRLSENPYELIKDYIEFPNMVRLLIISAYDNCFQTNDVAIKLLDENRVRYKCIFSILEVYGEWAKNK